MNFGTTYPQAWPRIGASATNPPPWQLSLPPSVTSAFNWSPQVQSPTQGHPNSVTQPIVQQNVSPMVAQQGHSGFNIAELAKALNAPSQLEQQHNDWVGAGSPSYLGNSHNPFNFGYFGATPGSQEFSGRTVATPQALAIPHQQNYAAGAVAASPAPYMPGHGPLPFSTPTLPPFPTQAQMDSHFAALRDMYAPGGFARLQQQQQQNAPTPIPDSMTTAGVSGARKFSPFGQWR